MQEHYFFKVMMILFIMDNYFLALPTIMNSDTDRALENLVDAYHKKQENNSTKLILPSEVQKSLENNFFSERKIYLFGVPELNEKKSEETHEDYNERIIRTYTKIITKAKNARLDYIQSSSQQFSFLIGMFPSGLMAIANFFNGKSFFAKYSSDLQQKFKKTVLPVLVERERTNYRIKKNSKKI